MKSVVLFQTILCLFVEYIRAYWCERKFRVHPRPLFIIQMRDIMPGFVKKTDK